MNHNQSHLITGNARVAGLQTDLHMTDKQYQICNTVIFVYVVHWNVVLKPQQHSRPHIASEFPSNLLFRKIGARLILPTTVILWGIVAILQGQQLGKPHSMISPYMYTSPIPSGFVTSYACLVTVRAFLGLVEGLMAPGIVLYLSGFYTRKELSCRYVSHLSHHDCCSGVDYPYIDSIELP